MIALLCEASERNRRRRRDQQDFCAESRRRRLGKVEADDLVVGTDRVVGRISENSRLPLTRRVYPLSEGGDCAAGST